MAKQRSIRNRLADEVRQARMGLGLTRVAADRRSQLLLVLLSLTPMAVYQARRGAGSFTVRIRLKAQTFPVRLQDRTDLAVLHEIAMDDEYGAADGVTARTVVDLGAHIGLGTLRLLAGHPGAHVVAVEADPRLVERLRANVSGLPVTVIHAAVGAVDGERTFFRSEGASWANSVSRVSRDQEAVTVPSMTLPALLDAAGVKRVDLLKIDVEGAEWEVMADGLPSGVGALMAEFHARDRRSPRELLRAMSGGLRPTVIREDDHQLVFFATAEGGPLGARTTI